jgi:hypothetical protein
MPSHVHILITPHVQVRLMQSLKRLTARQGNRMLTLTGHPFWQDESCDRLVRSQTTAGLAASPEQFAWSSGMPIHHRPQLKCRNSRGAFHARLAAEAALFYAPSSIKSARW